MSIDKLNHYLATKNWPKAAAVLAPIAKDPRVHPSMLYNYGKVLMELQDWQGAIKAFRRCLKRQKDHVNAQFELGRCLIEVQDYEPALTCFRDVVSRAPSDLDAWRNIGRITMTLGHWEEAQSAWARLSEDDPEAALALYRVSAELGLPDMEKRQAELLATHPNRVAVLQALVRVSQGSLPLTLPISKA